VAQAMEAVRDDLLLARYLRARRRFGPDRPQGLPPGFDIRTCAHCGLHTRFRVDPEGTWACCTACGQYA
jgi:hypothetical protein